MSIIESPKPTAAASPAAARPSRRRARVAAVGAGVLAALAVFVLAEAVAGIDLHRPATGADAAAQDIDGGHVAFTAAVGMLAAWGLLAVLERVTARARPIWIAIAAIAFVASLGGPLSGTGISAGNRAALLLMHVVVAAVAVSALMRTSPAADAARRS